MPVWMLNGPSLDPRTWASVGAAFRPRRSPDSISTDSKSADRIRNFRNGAAASGIRAAPFAAIALTGRNSTSNESPVAGSVGWSTVIWRRPSIV